ncbi:MAG: IPT/TIG domain-containing protein [Planctomycetota bacterium]|jgi:hypothetical protein
MGRWIGLITVLLIPVVIWGCSKESEDEYETLPAPTLVSVTPTEISAVEATLITIQGTDFQAGAAVFVDTEPGTNVVWVSDTTLTAFVSPPSGGASPFDLTVQNPDGQAATLVDVLTIPGAPTVTGVYRYGGDYRGGTTVTVSGSGFKDGAIVLFEGNPAIVNSIASDTIVCVTPSYSTTPVTFDAEVRVINPDNLAGAFDTPGYHYAPAPTNIVCNPANGAQAGGDVITITATDLQGGAPVTPPDSPDPTVTFDGVDATNYDYTGLPASFTCVNPNHTGAGPVVVRVTNPDAQFGDGTFDYNEFPVITSITPNQVSTVGGANVVLQGDFFLTGATVTINGFACSNYNYAGVPTTITFDVPANPVGLYGVTLTNPDTQAVTWGPTISPQEGLRYVPGPAVIQVTPDNGDILGGTAVVVTGLNFDITANGVSVGFGSEWVGPLTAQDSQTINVTTPPSNGQIGWVTVTVRNEPTTQTGSLTNGYNYTDAANPPDITLVTPASGSMAGGDTITVDGINFWNGTIVEINSASGWQACTNYVYAGVPTQILCDTPAGSGPGPWDVRAVNPDQTTETPPPALEIFTYMTVTPPTVTNVRDQSNNNTCGLNVTVPNVTVTGTDFYGLVNGATAEPTVTFVGIGPATAVNVVSTTSLTCTVPAAASPGWVRVEVMNADGQSGGMDNAWGYIVPAPTVIDVNTATIPPYAGYSGETVTVNGTGFYPGCTVTFGGGAAANVAVQGAGPPHASLTCDLPACDQTGGILAQQVIVTNPDLQPSTQNIIIDFVPLPTAITPSAGPTGVATPVTVSNTDGSFESGVSCTIGGQAVGNLAFVDAYSFTCTTPSGLVGAQPVVVTNPSSPYGPYSNPAPNLIFNYGTIRFWELTNWSDFGQQTISNTDYWTSLGDVQLDTAPGGFYSCGDIVTCTAYWEGGSTATNQRILVGTANSGAFLTTDGGSTWTAFNVMTHRLFPSNSINCVAFYSHSSSNGTTFMIGTNGGLAITRDGGTNFTIWNTGTTPALPYNNVMDVDFCDGATSGNFMLISTVNTGGGNQGGCLFTSNGGTTTTVFNETNNNLEPGGGDDTNRTWSADFYDGDTSGQTFLIACQGTGGWAGDGASFKTTNGGTSFTKYQILNPNWGGTQHHRIVRFNNAAGNSNSFLIGSLQTGGAAEGAVYTTNNGTSWTAVTRPGDFPVMDAAYYNGNNFMVAFSGGISITTNGGGAWNRISTNSTGGYANIADNYTRGVAWHTTIGNANSFLIGCGNRAGNVVNGGLEVTTNGGTAFTLFESDPAASNNLGPPTSVLPSADVTSVALDPGDSSGNTFLVGTRDGAALTTNGGTSWTWFRGGNIPSNNINKVAILTTGGNTYILLGTAAGVAYSANGGSSFSNETGNLAASGNNVTGVAFYDGTHYAVVTGGGGGDINFNNGGTWTAFDSLTAGIPSNDMREVDLYRGTGSMDWVIFGTPAGIVRGQFTSSTFTTYGGAGVLPSNNVRAVAFDQGAPTTNLKVVVATAGGGARGVNFQGTPTWTLYTTTNGLPSNSLRDCAYFGGVNNGNYFMFASDGGAVYTTDGWNSTIVVNRGTTGLWLPQNACSACAYFDGNTTGDRMLLGCPGPGVWGNGGVVLRAGVSYQTSGSLTIGQVDGLLLPAINATTPSLPDRNITGVGYHNGTNNANDFLIGSLYGIGVTTDGGQTFAPLRAPSTPSATQLPSSLISCTAFFKGSTQGILVGTFGQGAALTSNGGTNWTLYNTGTTPSLPSNNVQWVAFHDGDSNPDTFLICTDAGTLYVKNGTSQGVIDDTHAAGINNDHACADFDDLDTAGGYTFIICSGTFAGPGDAGAFYTNNDGTSFTRYFHNNPVPGRSSYKDSVAFHYGTQTGNSTNWFVAADPTRINVAQPGSLLRTTNNGGAFAQYDLNPSGALSGDACRLFALCDSTANPTHWMVYIAGTGIDVTSNGDQTVANTNFTTYTATSTPALPSNNVLSCAYWSGTGATGATWSVGTTAGFVQTTNGGANLGSLSSTPTGYWQLVVTETKPANTTITYDLLTPGGAPITGFQGLVASGGTVDISGVAIGTYPVIQVRVNLSTTNTSATPVLHDIQIHFQYP